MKKILLMLLLGLGLFQFSQAQSRDSLTLEENLQIDTTYVIDSLTNDTTSTLIDSTYSWRRVVYTVDGNGIIENINYPDKATFKNLEYYRNLVITTNSGLYSEIGNNNRNNARIAKKALMNRLLLAQIDSTEYTVLLRTNEAGWATGTWELSWDNPTNGLNAGSVTFTVTAASVIKFNNNDWGTLIPLDTEYLHRCIMLIRSSDNNTLYLGLTADPEGLGRIAYQTIGDAETIYTFIKQ